MSACSKLIRMRTESGLGGINSRKVTIKFVCTEPFDCIYFTVIYGVLINIRPRWLKDAP